VTNKQRAELIFNGIPDNAEMVDLMAQSLDSAERRGMERAIEDFAKEIRKAVEEPDSERS